MKFYLIRINISAQCSDERCKQANIAFLNKNIQTSYPMCVHYYSGNLKAFLLV